MFPVKLLASELQIRIDLFWKGKNDNLYMLASAAENGFSMGYLRRLISAQKRNIQNLSVLVFVNFAVAGVGFVTQVKIANVLGKESFGFIAFGVAIATYCAVIVRFGLDKTLVRDLIHYPDRFAATVKASLILRFSLLALVIALVLGWKIFQPPDGDVTWGVVLIIVANAAMSVDLQGIYDSWHKMSRHALYNLLQRGLYFLIIWFIVITNPEALSVFSVGAATLVSVSIYLALQYYWAMKRLPAGEVSDNLGRLAFNMMRGNVLVWLAALAGLSFGPLNQLVLKHFHGAAELGGYAAAWMMVTLVSIFLAQVARIGNPATARITGGSVSMKMRASFLLKYSGLMLVITSPIALIVIIEPEWVLGILFRAEYVSSASTLRVLGLYMLVFSTGLVAAQYIVSARLEKAYMQSVMIGGVAGVILCIALIPSSGGVGAAWALLLSHGFAILLYWIRIAISLRKEIAPA